MSKPLDLPFDPIDRASSIWTRRFGATPSMAAVTSVMRAQQILLASLDSLLRPYELTFARYEALVLLSFSRAGYLPLRTIGERLMVHPTSVTNIISRLEAQGFVELRPNPADGRGKLASLTPAGSTVMRRATADLMAAEFGLGGYTEAELAEMFTLFRGLRLSAGDFVADPSPGPAFAEDPCQTEEKASKTSSFLPPSINLPSLLGCPEPLIGRPGPATEPS
jgi:DNA-binding MarR family transcriptional regulator